MEERRGDFLDPPDRDALPLLDRERVIRRLHLNPGPEIAAPKMHGRFELERPRVTLLHGSAGWRREPGGVGRRPLP